MSGHSKWAQIKRKKALTDAKKGRLFSKLSKIIEVAAKNGGTDYKTNFSLKAAVEQARAGNCSGSYSAFSKAAAMAKDLAVWRRFYTKPMAPAGWLF